MAKTGSAAERRKAKLEAGEMVQVQELALEYNKYEASKRAVGGIEQGISILEEKRRRAYRRRNVLIGNRHGRDLVRARANLEERKSQTDQHRKRIKRIYEAIQGS